MPYKEDMPREMQQIATALLDQTRADEIQWQVTDSDSQFIFSSTRSAVLIIKSSDNLTANPRYQLQLLNGSGAIITSFVGRYIYDNSKGEFTPTGRLKLLEELYYAARSNALNIDNTLGDLYETLGLEPETSTE